MRRSYFLPVVAGLCAVAGTAWAQPSPQHQTITVHEGTSMAVSVSPDGKMLAMDLQGSIYVLPVGGGEARRVTDIFNDARQPQWSPDSKNIIFFGYRAGGYDLWEVGADGSNQHRVSFGAGRNGTPVWSPRGDLLAFTKQDGGRFDIGVMRVDGSGERLLTQSWLDEGPSWAPNGRVIIFNREAPGGEGGNRSKLYSVDVTGFNLREVPTPTDASDPANANAKIQRNKHRPKRMPTSV